ncbi:(deoxy)nucleoside triphosphate pyrophosphohydrolase [Thermobrachium celere]|uniref:(deoxy)nucleoside triphosphate pyrophosphohydrolase n=1 Tax=Thermobrachium celere TaxID=53422 RepID=UPI00194332C7|nr:(deoxy)nucleoside triphosphate pyrophosphohydrolase [Thermobrachium celere]GFR34359.1 DNA mismatch repair protein MutT [Thermobrachium celere]
MIIVTAAIIENEGKILITQRKKEKHGGLLWEFPGGKLEEGEDPKECIVREIKEELNIEIEVVDIFDVVFHRYTEFNMLMLVYRCRLLGGEITAKEVEDFRWVIPLELNEYNFLEADVGVVEKIITKNM